MLDTNVEHTTPDESAAPSQGAGTSPLAVVERLGKWIGGISKSYGSLVVLTGLIALGWDANAHWQDNRKAFKDEIAKERQEDRKLIQELREDQERIRSYLQLREKTALDEFFWICGERKGEIDYKEATCTFPERRTRTTFERLGSIERLEGSDKRPPVPP